MFSEARFLPWKNGSYIFLTSDWSVFRASHTKLETTVHKCLFARKRTKEVFSIVLE